MTRRVAKFRRELAQVVGAIGGPPPRAPGVPDMVEVQPGVWVRPGGPGPFPWDAKDWLTRGAPRKQPPAPLLQAVATAFGFDLDGQDLEDLKGIASDFGIDLEDEIGELREIGKRPEWKR